MVPLLINPPLLNSANPWCTTLAQLQELYNSPHTGAITTRTSLLTGFPHDPTHHQFTFFNPSTHASSTPNTDLSGDATTTGSLNTLGYSPILLSEYLSYVQTISDGLASTPSPSSNTSTSTSTSTGQNPLKPILISVTGTAEEIAQAYTLIHTTSLSVKMPLALEINLSCPNIPGKTPPAYSASALLPYLSALKSCIDVGLVKSGGTREIAVGVKIPPYTHQEQFDNLVAVLRESTGLKPVYLGCPVSFITAVNTLGSSLVLTDLPSSSHQDGFEPKLMSASGLGIGGLAGAPLHPLALGNVRMLRKLLDAHEDVKSVMVIGTGGVEDKKGFERMRWVGAGAVGVGTALGRKGVDVFREIMEG